MYVLDEIAARSHLILGGVRFVNGVAALLAPSSTSRRLGIDPEANPAAIYPLRMFGVRTVVLGLELLAGSSRRRRRRMRVGIAIHASDALAALLGGLRGHLPPKTAAVLTGVSTANTALAVIGSRRPHRRGLMQRLRQLG